MNRVLLFAVLLTGCCLFAANNNYDPEVFAVRGKARDYTNVFPPQVKTIAVITPASYPGPKTLLAGIKLLRKAGYKVKVYPNVLRKPEVADKTGYAAIPVEYRIADFEAAWRDLENDMIICSRGGRGTEELVANINWAKLPRRPELFLLGYSDVTMLLSFMVSKGYGRPVAGPTANGLPGLAARIVPVMKKVFHGEAVSLKLKPLKPGEASGKVVAGLLSRYVRVVDAGYDFSARGKIVVIESVSCTSRGVSRDLEFLLQKGFFKDASALVFGHFARPVDKKQIDIVLEKFAGKLDIPVYRGFPFGHQADNLVIDFSRPAFIKNNVITFPEIKPTKDKENEK
ncbi:MAG: LD-carboxypeptidase [Lentisphaerae bacterium]|nr:LD-carboxypeptidase [Lentisphaerota bacterium]